MFFFLPEIFKHTNSRFSYKGLILPDLSNYKSLFEFRLLHGSVVTFAKLLNVSDWPSLHWFTQFLKNKFECYSLETFDIILDLKTSKLFGNWPEDK